MCGIVGVVGNEPAAPIALKAISRLEYRGYDSAGMVSVANGKIHYQKDVGRIVDVQRKHRLDRLPGDVALGHVRWATHGRATRQNAHPHFDCKKQVAIVHNGIIENYQELRSELAGTHRFVSEADTEVVCHLVEDYIARGETLEGALAAATRRLEGAYAIAAVSCLEPDKIVATARDVPLVVGLNGDCYFVASDALSISEVANEVVFLEESEIASLTKEGVTFFDRHGEKMAKEAQPVSWRWEDAEPEGHDCFMSKEIQEEPKAVVRATMQDIDRILALAGELSKAKRVLLTACGSSYHAALLGKYLLSRIGGRLCDVITASELQYFTGCIARDALVFAVSQSGETADVVDAVKRAKAEGARVFSLVNVVGSMLARISDEVIYLNCGPEVCVAATKSFVAQVTLFYLLAHALAGRLDEGLRALHQVARQIEENLERNDARLRDLAQRTMSSGSFFFIARGPNLAVAAEGALKVKEISYVHAECMPAGELKHGTLALIEEGTPVVAVCPRDDTFPQTMSNVMETKSRGAFVIGVSDEDNEAFDVWIEVPPVNSAFYPLAAVPPLHLLAYHVAVARGRNPDRPRNLAKSVTVR